MVGTDVIDAPQTAALLYCLYKAPRNKYRGKKYVLNIIIIVLWAAVGRRNRLINAKQDERGRAKKKK